MFKILITLLVTFFVSVSWGQEQVVDPTKPLGFAAATATSGDASQTIQLTSILISSERRVAIINGEALVENQVIKGVGASVKRIDAETVTLQQNGKVWRVALDNTAIRK